VVKYCTVYQAYPATRLTFLEFVKTFAINTLGRPRYSGMNPAGEMA
jgi:hypothetical protein